MDNKQITVDELIDAYQKEMSVLSHNKIMTTLQIEKMSKYITELEEERSNLLENIKNLGGEINKLKTKESSRKVRATSE